jgi:hypothetical protein
MADSLLNKYFDPPTTQDIIEEMTQAPTLGDVKQIVDREFPTWFIGILTEYCPDYPHLTMNWHRMTEIPQAILMVEFLAFDYNHLLLTAFVEIFTKAGFSVRVGAEFAPCPECHAGVPVQGVYDMMKVEGKDGIPDSWSTRCKRCWEEKEEEEVGEVD